MGFWHQCRSVEEFKRDGMNLSTCSDNAAKYLDAVADQYCGWTENAEFGGFEGTMNKLFSADPDCVMGRIVSCALQLLGTGTSVKHNVELREMLNELVKQSNAEKPAMSDWERMHVRALQLFSNGYIEAACDTWDRILIDSPLDMFALHFTHDACFYTGRATQMHDSVARVFPRWNRNMLLYKHLFGMLSFGLVETYRYDEAEKVAMEGLALSAGDGWSTHSVAHVREMTVQYESGAQFLQDRRHLWSCASALSVHLDWHYCLFNIESGDYDRVLHTYDDYMLKRLLSPQSSILDIVDGSSLLYRLELEGQNVGTRWQALADACVKHTKDHVTLFNDVHFLMSFLGAGRKAQRDELLGTFREFLDDKTDAVSLQGIDESWNRQLLRKVGASLSHTNRVLGEQIGDNLLNGMCSYANGDYDEAFEKLYPIRYEIDSLTYGGSHAQRDIYKQLLIHACLQSSKYRCSYARGLLYERLGKRTGSPLTERLVARFESFDSLTSGL